MINSLVYQASVFLVSYNEGFPDVFSVFNADIQNPVLNVSLFPLLFFMRSALKNNYIVLAYSSLPSFSQNLFSASWLSCAPFRSNKLCITLLD